MYNETKTQFTQISVTDGSAMAIDTDGKLWGWGQNMHNRLGHSSVNEEIGINKPFSLYLMNNLGFKALKISCGFLHSLVLFEDKEGHELLYSVGIESSDFSSHLGVSEEKANNPEIPFNVIPTFNDRKVLDFCAHDGQASIVIVAGVDNEKGGIYHHNLPGGKTAKGLLHFYKQGDSWHFVSEQ